MANHEMPVLTQEQREGLIYFINSELSGWDPEGKYHRVLQIALAALAAEPAAWRWKKNDEIYFDGIKPIGVEIQDLYFAPPVPALRLPDELTWSHQDDVTQAEVMAWNNCLAEAKRLNATAPAVKTVKLNKGALMITAYTTDPIHEDPVLCLSKEGVIRAIRAAGLEVEE